MKLQRRPAPKRIASSISLDRRDAVVDQPQRLAPQRLQQPVGDEAVDLLSTARSGCMPTDAVDVGGALRSSPADVAAPPHDLDQRQQVDRVERMADDEPLGVRHAGLQLGRQQARGRRARYTTSGRRAALAAAQQLAA